MDKFWHATGKITLEVQCHTSLLVFPLLSGDGFIRIIQEILIKLVKCEIDQEKVWQSSIPLEKPTSN